jgi:integrase
LLLKCFSKMNVKFYVRKSCTESKIIICILKDHANMLRLSTEHTISVNHWDAKSQRAKKTMIGYEQLNDTLDHLKMEVLKQILEYKLHGVTEWPVLKQYLKKYFRPESAERIDGSDSRSSNHSIVQMFDVFLAARMSEYKPETIRKYKILQKVLISFQKFRKKKIQLSDISFSLMEEFRLYLLVERKNRNDTIYKMLAALKCMIKWLNKNGFSIDSRSLEIRQKVKVKHDIVTLSLQELLQIESVKVNIYQEPIRDCFLFQVYTGQRFSDMQQLVPEQVMDNVWKFKSIKTGKDMHVPMVGWCSKAREIGEKYSFRFPKYSLQYFNREITKICREAKITNLVNLTRYQGSNLLQLQKPKCDWVSSHTARRTCVSILLEKGVPPTVVMKLTGHSSIQTMMRYERTTNDALVNYLLSIQF